MRINIEELTTAVEASFKGRAEYLESVRAAHAFYNPSDWNGHVSIFQVHGTDGAKCRCFAWGYFNQAQYHYRRIVTIPEDSVIDSPQTAVNTAFAEDNYRS